jgi:hypothetical protein
MTDQARDRFVAPGMSTFTEATIQDMSGVCQPWLSSFILNSTLIFRTDDATRRTNFNFLRKAEAAFREYEAARKATVDYLADGRPNAISPYILAVDHWEQFLSLADQAWTVLVRGQRVLYDREDGSVLQRLNRLHNLTKHIESAIKGPVADGPQFPDEGTLPVWLANDGLHSVEGVLTFAEIADILEDLARWCDAAQNPLTMRETILAAYGAAPDEAPAGNDVSHA